MANWSDLKAAVASIVKTNGNKEITGQLLQNVLNNIISNVGLNSSFAGIATPETNPGTPDGNVFYLATTAGTYSNFSGIVINTGEAVILEWKGSWIKKDSGFSTKEKLSDLEENTNQKLSDLGFYVENPEYVKVIIDSANNIIAGVKKDGTVVLNKLIVKGELYNEELRSSLSYISDTFNKKIFDVYSKFDEPTSYFGSIDNPEWLHVIIDNEEKIIAGIRKNGEVFVYTPTTFKENDFSEGNTSNVVNEGSISSLFPKYKWEGYIANLATTKNLGAKNDLTYKPLVLQHFSDIHNDANMFARVLEFNNMYKKYIDDILLSGDIAGSDWQGYSDAMTSLEGYYDVLKIIGNHDVSRYNGTNNRATEAQCFDRYMQGIENWGVKYTDGACYWYKDYIHNTGTKDNFKGSPFSSSVGYAQSSMVTYNGKYYKAKGDLSAGAFNSDLWEEITSFGIRLIGYDFMHITAAQNQWLASTLADAAAKGLSVIITTHGTPFLEDNTVEYFNTPFDGKEWVAKSESNSTPLSVVSAVSEFIDNGGEFICYLSGHVHTDKCGYFKTGTITTTNGTTYINNHKQVFIIVGLASGYNMVYDYYSGQSEIDIQKVKGTKTLDLFNIESFDTETKTISILRIGCDIDRLLRSRRSMVIDYKNSELIYSR